MNAAETVLQRATRLPFFKEREEMKRGNAHREAFMSQHKEYASNKLCST